MEQSNNFNKVMESENHFKNRVCLKTKVLFLVVIMSFIAINMMAQTWKAGDNVTATLSGDKMTISGTGHMTSSPWISDGYGDKIKQVIIEDGVTSITYRAFISCSNLTSVSIGKSVVYIRQYAFQNCSGLTSLTIPNSVTTIEIFAFASCTGLTSLTLGDSDITIESGAFAYITGIKSMTIGSGLTSLNNLPLSSTELTQIIVSEQNKNFSSIDGVLFNKDKTTIIKFPRKKNNSEFSYIIPNTVTTIGGAAFEYCTWLTSIIIPNTVTTIESSAFQYCSGLTSLTIPNSVNSIGTKAFSGCLNLKNIVIENGETTLSFGTTNSVEAFMNTPIETLYLGRYMSYYNASYSPFKDKTSLTSLTIGNDVVSIKEGAFRGCSGLVSITCKATIPPIIEIYAFSGVSSATKVIIPCQTLPVYQNSDWKMFTNFTEDGDCSGVAQLSSLTTSKGKLEFAPDVYSYDVVVQKNIDKITLTATAAYGGTFSGVGEKTLQFGKNDFPVTVYSENGKSNKIYTVSVIRMQEEFWMELTNSETIYGAGFIYNVQNVAAHQLTYKLFTGNYTGNIQLQFNLDGKDGAVAKSKVIENAQVNSVYQIKITFSNLKSCYLDVTNQFGTTVRHYLYYDFIASAKTGGNYPVKNLLKIIGIPTLIDDISVSYAGSMGINSIDKKAIVIYPNPATDFITISGLQNNEKLDFYTVDGQLLFTHKTTKETEYITVSHIPTGMYFVKTGNGQILKWIKQ